MSRQEGWVIAVQYANLDLALTPYERTRDLIAELNIEASVYRLRTEPPHVVIIGEGEPLEEHLQKFREICSEGVPTTLPEETLTNLWIRRGFLRPTNGMVEIRDNA